VRVAAPLGGVTLKEAGRRIGYRLLTLDEIRAAVEAWMGSDLKTLAPVASPKLVIENPKVAAAVALGALRMTGGAVHAAEPQVVALLAGTALRQFHISAYAEADMEAVTLVPKCPFCGGSLELVEGVSHVWSRLVLMQAVHEICQEREKRNCEEVCGLQREEV
jgi:hypothetical protein